MYMDGLVSSEARSTYHSLRPDRNKDTNILELEKRKATRLPETGVQNTGIHIAILQANPLLASSSVLTILQLPRHTLKINNTGVCSEYKRLFVMVYYTMTC